MVRTFAPALGRRPHWMALGLMVAVCSAAPTRVHAQAAQAPAAQAPAARVFASDAGMVLNFIKADKTGDFEAVIGKLKEALQKSEKPERKQQAASWKVFKSADPGSEQSGVVRLLHRPARQGRGLYGVDDLERRLSARGPGALQAIRGGLRDRPELPEPLARVRPRQVNAGADCRTLRCQEGSLGRISFLPFCRWRSRVFCRQNFKLSPA